VISPKQKEYENAENKEDLLADWLGKIEKFTKE
jgi:hypothetical protein